MIGAVLNHLWQSTLLVAAAGLLTLMLRRNGAYIRFWLWFVSSVKFLIPFAAVTSLCTYLPVHPVPRLPASAISLMRPAAQPFSTPLPLPLTSAVAAPRLDLTALLLLLWAVGFAAIVGRWLVRWWRLHAVLREAVDLPIAAPVLVKTVQTSLEPGLVGIWRPVVLLPRGITEHLSGTELDAIMAHEICHVRRRDNLLAAIHMLVEALFWFYPPVWWLGARLNAERERACDESVLASGRVPKIYAESILKVCRLYLHSPLACAAGVSGSDLKKRLEIIMESQLLRRLDWTKKLALSAAAFVTAVAPVVLGLGASPPLLAQASQATVQSPDVSAELRAEQALPRKVVPFDPTHFDRYVGYYQLGPTSIMTVTRDGSHFLGRLTGQVSVEWFPESETKFFATVVPAQISFNTDSAGRVTELVLHQGGREQQAPRVDEAAAKRLEASLIQRIKANTPSPGTEAALRNEIENLENGRRDLSHMMPGLAAAAMEQWPMLVQNISGLGALKSIAFKAVSPQGWDIYQATFERGSTEWQITPLTPERKITGLFWRRVP